MTFVCIQFEFSAQNAAAVNQNSRVCVHVCLYMCHLRVASTGVKQRAIYNGVRHAALPPMSKQQIYTRYNTSGLTFEKG